jgi:hypothetical protein
MQVPNYRSSKVFVLPETSSLRLVVCVPSGRADTRGQYSTLCYAGAAERGAGEEERRRDEGTGEGAKEVAREEERRKDEGTGEGAKEVARAGGGEAAG